MHEYDVDWFQLHVPDRKVLLLHSAFAQGVHSLSAVGDGAALSYSAPETHCFTELQAYPLAVPAHTPDRNDPAPQTVLLQLAHTLSDTAVGGASSLSVSGSQRVMLVQT